VQRNKLERNACQNKNPGFLLGGFGKKTNGNLFRKDCESTPAMEDPRVVFSQLFIPLVYEQDQHPEN
jgi:hypothetical protein